MFVYPRNQLDSSDFLLSLLGSFWHNIYEGNDLVQETAFARGQLEAQAYLQFLELVRSCSHYDVPVYHTDNWYFLRFKESESGWMALAKFEDGSSNVFQPNQELAYGEPQPTSLFYAPCPADLKQVPLLLNRISGTSLTWVAGVDYYLGDEGLLAFRSNPFEDERVPLRDVYDATGAVVDREAGLWVFRGSFDWDTTYQQFGYALGLKLQSSEGYKQLVSTILDGLALGTTARSLHLGWSAITGIPLVLETETVELVQTDAQGLVIVTNRHAYRFATGSVARVAAGDAVRAGDALTTNLQFYELHDGLVPEDITGLSFGAGLLANGYYGPLRFENESVPLVVETLDGITRVSFEIHGYPGDVEMFWDEVHARGLASGKTLAHFLDQRTNATDEPGAASLPATINPLEFLCSNLLRYHVFVVRVIASRLGTPNLGLSLVTQLRRLIPPETAMIVLVELEQADEFLLTGAGTTEVVGAAETRTGFQCMTHTETLDTSHVQEAVRGHQLYGKCE